jgi:hypothetical protein
LRIAGTVNRFIGAGVGFARLVAVSIVKVVDMPRAIGRLAPVAKASAADTSMILDSMLCLYNTESHITNMEGGMSFREKLAWGSLVSTVVIWGGFFLHLLGSPADARGMAMLGPFVLAVLVQTVVMIVMTAYWSIRAPGEANVPADEREKAIGGRATASAYLVLVAGVIAIIAALHVGLHGTDVIFALAGAFILAEAVRYGSAAVAYRRGA